MTGRRRYAFEIATQCSGQWSATVAASGLFSRAPKATVRSIAERWIFEQAGQLQGGRLVIFGRRSTPPRSFEAFVRIRILDVRRDQLAVAYIGVDKRGDPVVRSADDVKVGRAHYLSAALVVVGLARG